MSGQLDLSTKTIKIYGGAFDAAARSSIAAHLADLDNPHDVDKTDVGLGNVDNTSDANKPVSTAQAAALALKANLASPALTGTPTAPTASPGTVTTQIATTAFAQAAANAVASDLATTAAALASHVTDLTNPHEVDKTDVGLGNVDNTSDANKPVSAAQQIALNLKANLASPTFTGTPAGPTAAPGTDTTQLATTEFVTDAAAAVTAATTASLALKANLASPALTGTPTSTTASPGDNSVRIATTAFVAAADALKANLASPTFTGTPAAPTAAPGTNTTQIATTAFVKAADDIVAAAAAAAQADADQALLEVAPVPSLVAQQPGRPGDAVRLFSETKTGSPDDGVQIDPTWIATAATGEVVRVDSATAADPQTVATRAAYAFLTGRVYEILYRVERQTDPEDPLNDSVTIGVRWLQSDKTGVVVGGETVFDDIALIVADGPVLRTARLESAPAGAIYFRPFIDLYGDSHVTDVIMIDVQDITAAVAPEFLYVAPTEGATVSLAPIDEYVILNPAATLTNLTLELAPGINKKHVKIHTRQRIDNLQITPDGSDATDWTTNELPAKGSIDLRFVEVLDTWVLS